MCQCVSFLVSTGRHQAPKILQVDTFIHFGQERSNVKMFCMREKLSEWSTNIKRRKQGKMQS